MDKICRYATDGYYDYLKLSCIRKVEVSLSITTSRYPRLCSNIRKINNQMDVNFIDYICMRACRAIK